MATALFRKKHVCISLTKAGTVLLYVTHHPNTSTLLNCFEVEILYSLHILSSLSKHGVRFSLERVNNDLFTAQFLG